MRNPFRRSTPAPEKRQPIVVVSGLPRSGTSMMMKMLEAGGIPPLTDAIRSADTDNPKGYYEFERVKQLDKGDTDWLPLAEGKVVKVISALLRHLPEGHTYQIVFVRRNMPEILASQRKMLINRGEDPDALDEARMAELFEKHIAQTEAWMNAQPNISWLAIHYSDILADPETAALEVTEFLNRDLDVPAMAEVVDPDLYRNRQRVAGAIV